MKQKIRKALKNRIFLCTLTAIIFGTVGVSAATYFQSSDVTYDNTESGLKSKDVQGAIDELYNVCSPSQSEIPISEQIIKNNSIVTSGDGLYKDEYENGKYTYKGTNPNNYITFNNEQAGWRIISLELDGTIKIIKNKSIGTSTITNYGSSTIDNYIWSSASNEYLNGNFYSTLKNKTKLQIKTHNFNIGKIDWKNNNIQQQIVDEKEKNWLGNIGLPTVSEYLRANSNKSQCETWSLNNDYSNTCLKTNWMYKNEYWWLISPSTSSYPGYMGTPDGKIGTGQNTSLYNLYPTIYLSSTVKITGGTGTKNDPYTIE